MNEPRTSSILQRVPRILAVTAASYGLAQQTQAHRANSDGSRRAAGKVVTPQPDQADRELAALHA